MTAGVPDLLIVGGGPAGLATAIAAAESGLTARVIERGAPPLDKACGEGILPDGARWLAAHGVTVPAGESFGFRGIRYLLEGDLGGGGAPIAAEADFPGLAGLAVRRPVLHRALTARAEALGVELGWGVAARGLAPQGIETDDGLLRAQVVVGADGLHSRVRRWAGLDAPPATPLRRRRFGVRRHFRVAPWSERVEVHWGAGCEAYVTPVSDSEVGVALLWRGEKARFDPLLAHFPTLARRLAGAEVTSRDRGAGPFHQRARTVVRGRVVLVGDAAGYLDALTGEGLAAAFHQASALVAAVRSGELAAYRAAWRRLMRRPLAMTGLLLAIEAAPRAARRLVATLACDPALFARLLGVHARALPPRRVGLGGAARLAGGLLGRG